MPPVTEAAKQRKLEYNAWYKTTKGARRTSLAYRLRSNYNMTMEQWLAAIRQQRGLCDICRKKRRLLVDHDHCTGLFRAGLCRKCNLLVGMANEQVGRLRTFDTESLRSWLITPIGIEGATPLSLITAGKDDVVKAAAIRSRKPGTWTPLTSSLAFERTGLARSSVPRVGSRGWKASIGINDEDRLEQLLPAALPEADDPEEFETDESSDGRGLYIP